MGTTSKIISDISSYQTLISAGISALMVLLGLMLKERFDRRSKRRNYILDNGYGVNERLRDNLVQFLENEPFKYTSFPKKVGKDHIQKVKTSYKDYEKLYAEEDPFWRELTRYDGLFKEFEKLLLKDIIKVTKLSIPKVQKAASEIERLYEIEKENEEVLSDLFQDEFVHDISDMDFQLSPTQRSYVDFIEESYKEMFWIQAYKLLLKLRQEIEHVVKLEI